MTMVDEPTRVADVVRIEGGARQQPLVASWVLRLDGWPLGTFTHCVGLPDEHTFGYGLAGTVRLVRRSGTDTDVLAAWVAAVAPTRAPATITAYDDGGVAVAAWRLRDAWLLRHDATGARESLQLAHSGVLRSAG